MITEDAPLLKKLAPPKVELAIQTGIHFRQSFRKDDPRVLVVWGTAFTKNSREFGLSVLNQQIAVAHLIER